MLASGLALLILTLVAFGQPLSSLTLLFQGAFGDKYGLSTSIVRATPLMLCALGVTVAWKSGMYSIGGEGQFVLGGVVAATVMPCLMTLPRAVFLPALVLASVLGGAVFALIPGWMSTKRGSQIVVSTILLNFVAIQILKFAVAGPLRAVANGIPMSLEVPEHLRLGRLGTQLDLHYGVILALLVALLVALLFSRSKLGFMLRLVGEAPGTARANRISASRAQLLAMIVSGALCGLAGGLEYMRNDGQLGTDFSQNWGFLAIPVALVGGLRPLGVIASSLMFGALFAGSENLSRYTTSGSSIILIVQAVLVLAYVGYSARFQGRLQEST